MFSRLAFALVLTLIVGFGATARGAAAKNGNAPQAASGVATFRSIGKNDGFTREYADDYWFGGSVNSTAATIVVGDDQVRRLTMGILDFDTSILPDTATVTYATLEVRVTRYNTRFGDPYLLLGDMYADIVSPYFGASYKLEAQDFESLPADYAGFFWPVTGPGQWAYMEVDLLALPMIDVFDHTQFRLYFFDDNEDSYPHGLSFASGNAPQAAYRPLLTVYYDVP